MPPEHPRVGGEDVFTWGRLSSVTGTPPRRRGGLAVLDHEHLCGRNTPASAGRTTRAGCTSGRSPEHPRVGGEDANSIVSKVSKYGTPPRRRGGPHHRRYGGVADRNTPASAGRTSAACSTPSATSEHPRVGGEDLARVSRVGAGGGTPPRRRGGQDDADRQRAVRRNTPASAGRTPAPRRPHPGTPEHPRVGGEDSTSTCAQRCPTGTPPRRRGGRGPELKEAPVRRNTPASAGRTRSPPGTGRSSTEHPRVGGEDRGGAAAAAGCRGTPPRRRGGRRGRRAGGAGRRNTPASAGRTRSSCARPGRTSEHPRVGGEDEL